MNRVLCGDVLAMLSTLSDESVDCVVTSPPYWGLRDYGTEPIVWPDVEYAPMAGLPIVAVPTMACSLGAETTPEAFVGHLVLVFREILRVLRPRGTCWVNMGDTYASAWPCSRRSVIGQGSPDITTRGKRIPRGTGRYGGGNASAPGLKEKDLCMIPARMALALQADGYYCRQDIVWSKPNPMPESVTDRCTKSHEYVFLLTKSPKYWYDADAIRQPFSDATLPRLDRAQAGNHAPGQTPHSGIAGPRSHKGSTFDKGKTGDHQQGRSSHRERAESIGGANKRSVWTIATAPYPEAHFATFPEELPRTCILAGCPVGGVVLDPFAGSGTTLAVALMLGRQYVGIELNPEYLPLIERRLARVTPPLDLFSEEREMQFLGGGE